MKLVTVTQMRALENRAAEIGLPAPILMKNAGRAVAREIAKQVEQIEGCSILIVIGPGNNGGDGLVTACYLHEWGADVRIYLSTERSATDPNYIQALNRKIPIATAADDKQFIQLEQFIHSSQIVVDALLGIGKSRPLAGTIKQITTTINGAREKTSNFTVVALDIPSGLDSDTGHMDPAGINADVTITLGYPKTGLFTFPGAKNVGKLIIADIGIPSELTRDINVEMITKEQVKSLLPIRPLDAHKGTFGKVLVIGGSLNYVGAPYLACFGAIRVGAGLVTLAISSSLQSILATKMNEVTYLPLPEKEPGIISLQATNIIQEQLNNYDVLLIGCGMGQNPATNEFIISFLASLNTRTLPRLVIDADALNTLAQYRDWWRKIPDDAIVTPHPGEMSRLTGLDVSEIQSRRLDTTRDAAKLWQKTVVLKGAYTVVAAPDGKIGVNPFTNPGLSSAGTGDVLSGIVAGMVAQGLASFDAACCGVFLHSNAGELVKETLGDTGMLATDLLPVLPLAIKHIQDTR